MLNKNFLKYVSSGKSTVIIAAALALGVLLIFIGSDSRGKAEGTIEDRLAVLCSEVEGVGECSVMIYRSDSDGEGETVESVIVICEGADSADVRRRLTEMLSSFFGIGANRIRIEKSRTDP